MDGEFDIVVQGWGPDYNDPLTFGDLYRVVEPEQPRTLQQPGAMTPKCASRSGRSIRACAWRRSPRCRRLIFEDAAIVLNYERGVMYVQDPRLKGVAARTGGIEPDYTAAYHGRRSVIATSCSRYTLKRLVQGVITVWFIATATFVAMHAVPGDPLSGERVPNAADPHKPARRATGSTGPCSSST